MISGNYFIMVPWVPDETEQILLLRNLQTEETKYLSLHSGSASNAKVEQEAAHPGTGHLLIS